MPTVNQLAKKLAKEYTMIDTDPVYVAQVEEWINEAYADLMTTRWDFAIASEDTITTVASTATYSLATSVGESTSVRITTTDQPIQFIHYDSLVRRHQDIELTGTPRYYYLSGYDESTGKNKITLWPIPNAVLTIKVANYKMPEELFSYTTIPVPYGFLAVLKSRTRFNMSMDDGHIEDAQAHLTLYGIQIKERQARQRTHPDERRNKPIQDLADNNEFISPQLPSNYPNYW